MTDTIYVVGQRRKSVIIAATSVFVVAISVGLGAASAQAINQSAAALAEFQDRLQAYLTLRADLASKLEPLSSTADSAKLTAQQEALAAALRTARKGAKPGDLIPPSVERQIRDAVVADFARRTAKEKHGIFEEVPEGVRPVINNAYPAGAALPTVPPLLLTALPILPDNLQYRFFGRHIVLIDGDAHIIVDYIQNVLPPHRQTQGPAPAGEEHR